MSLNFIDDDIDDSENEKDKSSSATNNDTDQAGLGEFPIWVFTIP